MALERLHDETLDNLAVLDSVDAEMAIKLGRVPAAIDALQSCEHTENNVALIENGLRSIVGTMTIHIKMSALDELTSAPSLLAQQPLSMRDQLST
ncbi:MAG: hypothetical protein KJO88_04860, partial [Gammaproteobacteria bacterium]|nr:hypothetical protein [Gammaproteobacteria bacterium]